MKHPLIACALLTLSGLTPAFAHAILETKQAQAGTIYKGEIGITHGCKGSPTVSVDLTIPEGVIGVKPFLKPGWTIKVLRGPYAKSYPSMHGAQTEGVKEIIWSGGNLPDDFVDDFAFRGEIAADVPAGPLYFPVVQTCAQGAHRWVDVPGASQPASDHPAPALTILAAADPSSVQAGSLKIENAFTRPTLGGATVAVGYMTIVNNGTAPDTLVSVTSDVSASAEIHESKMQNGVMEMGELPNGLAIPPGGTVTFKPGSYHLMFVGLKHPVKPGDAIHAILTFAKAGKVAVTFTAADSFGATAPGGAMGGMKMP